MRSNVADNSRYATHLILSSQPVNGMRGSIVDIAFVLNTIATITACCCVHKLIQFYHYASVRYRYRLLLLLYSSITLHDTALMRDMAAVALMSLVGGVVGGVIATIRRLTTMAEDMASGLLHYIDCDITVFGLLIFNIAGSVYC